MQSMIEMFRYILSTSGPPANYANAQNQGGGCGADRQDFQEDCAVNQERQDISISSTLFQHHHIFTSNKSSKYTISS